MRKFLSILLVVTMVFSLVVVGKAPVAQAAVSGLRTASSDTGLPTYVMGEFITGKSTVAGDVYLKDTALTPVDSYYVPAANGSFVLKTSPAKYEGKYIVKDADSVASDVYVYLKYNISNVTPASAPAVGSTILVSGKLYLGDTAQTPANGVTVVLAYEGPANTWNFVTSGTTLDGQFAFYAKFANAARYALFVSDGYAPDFGDPNAAIYYEWTVGPTSITVTNVFEPTLLYAGNGAPTTQYAYVRLTYANGKPITSGVTFTQVSGVGKLISVNYIPKPDNQNNTTYVDGIYELQVEPTTAGIMNLKASTSTAQGTFSLYFKPWSNMWNPSVRLTNLDTGFVIGGQVGFSASYGVGSSYMIGVNKDVNNNDVYLQYTTLDGPVYMAGEFGNDEQGIATFSAQKIMGGGQITITLKAMLWTPSNANALDAQPQEVEQVFKVNPTISGDIVTVSPTSVTVGDTTDITVTVKTAAGIERNNAKVTLIGSAGMFTIPKDAPYFDEKGDGSTVVLDASGNVNENIVGGKYVFNGLKFNNTGSIEVKVEVPNLGLETFDYLEMITVDQKVVTLTADVDHLVAGQIYPVVKVSGGVAGLKFESTPSVSFSTIDNGDGTYIFNIQGVPDVEKVKFTATDPNDSNKEYELTLKVVKPTLTFLSVHKDGLITDSFTETVEFTVVDPDTSAYMTPTDIKLVPQYTAWEATKNKKFDNLQVTQGENANAKIGLTKNSIDATWKKGNKNVDWSVYKPYVALTVTINGQTITFKNALLVTPPTISFKVEGRDTLQLYVNQSNTICATALDAHNQPLKNAKVGIAGSLTGDWSSVEFDKILAYGVTGPDGKTVFTFTPTYIGNYNLMLAPASSDNPLRSVFVPAVQAPPDTTAPTVTITEPADGAEVNTSTVKVKGTATDNVGVVALYVNDMKVDLLPDGSFVTQVTLTEGKNVITVKAFDAAGNKTEKSVTVTYTKPVSKQTVVVLKIGSDIMTVNGNVVQLDAAPEIKDGRTFLPLRAIAEAFGAQVSWVPETQGITVVLGDNQIGLQVGNNSAVVNGNVLSIVPPYIKNGRTMVPVRVIAEGLGAKVEWDPINYIVTITMEG